MYAQSLHPGVFFSNTMMRKLLPLLLLLLTACEKNTDRVEIEGNFEGIQQAQFYIYTDEGSLAFIDTLKVENGKFSYSYALQKPVILTLLFPNFSEIQLVAEPGKNIEVEGNAAHLLETKVSGSEENELLSDFRIQNQHLGEREIKMAVADFIHSHSRTQAAIALFIQYFVKAEQPDAETALTLLDALRKAQPENLLLLQIDTQNRAAFVNGVGKKIISFEAYALDSTKITQASYDKPLLITTFATWNNECISTIKALKKLRSTYGDSLALLNIALDAEVERLKVQMERDTMLSVTVCEQKGFDSPLALRLGLNRMPGHILVDKDGTIVKRNIRTDHLEKHIDKLLKK